ncbi:MAG: PAS domain S-box protein, partial [Candidatus Thorarchaeota archaeon]
FDAEVSLNAIEIDGKILIQALVRDITKRTQAENDLKESEERYRILYDNLPDGVIGVDTNGIITFCNTRVLEMFRYDKEDEVVGRRLDEFMHPDYKGPAMQSLKSSLAEGKTALDGFEGLGIRRDGSEIYFHLSSSFIKVGDSIVGFQSHIRDLSEWKGTQEQLKRQREELSIFAHSMAHDLRSSIHVIVGLADLHKEDRKDKHLTDIIGIAGKMDSILSKSVELAEAGIVIGERTLVNLEELFREVAITSIPDEIKVNIGGLPLLSCDRAKMVQVIQNLMQNAHEHGKATTISVSSKIEEDTFSISVSNDGVPIPEEYRDKFFEHGFSTKAKGGLGLSIIQRIVEAHGWKISLQSIEPATLQIDIPSKDIHYN